MSNPIPDIFADLKLAFRRLAKAPGFAAVAVSALALGIGANTAIFSIINRVVLQPLPYVDPDRLVQIWEDYKGDGTGQNTVSGGVAHSWEEQSDLLEDIAASNRVRANLSFGSQPIRLNGLQVSSSYLRLLRINPSRGRDFLPEEGRAGKSDVVILTYAAWQSYFGGRVDVLGQTIQISNKPTTVIGILGPDARLTVGADFLAPFAYGTPGWSTAFTGHNLFVVGRLKPNATLSALKSEMAAITDRIRGNFPDFKRKWGVTVVPLHEQVTGALRPQLVFLFGVTACVLLIACFNVAGLLLARAISREREMALRLALGATGFSIARQVLLENVILSLAGGAFGSALASWGVAAFERWRPPEFAPGMPVTIDVSVLAFALVMSVLAGLASGLAPAWRLARSRFDQLRSGDRSSARGAHTGLRGALIVGQVAISLVLLAGAGLLLQSLIRLQAVPLGFQPNGVLAADLTLASDSFRDPIKRTSYLDQIVQAVRSVPGVDAVGVSTYLPLQTWDTEYVSLDGSTIPPIVASVNFVTDGYYPAMRIQLLKGRLLRTGDNKINAAPTMLVDADLAAKFFPNQDPIGRHLSFLGHGYEIVGVTGNVLMRGAGQQFNPEIYLPESRANGFDLSIVVRTTMPPLSLSKAVQTAIFSVAPDQSVSNMRSYEHIMEQQAFARRLMLGLTSLFAFIAVALAAIGLYGIMAFTVDSRMRELGIRTALGARRRGIFILVISSGLKLTMAGVVLGLIGSYFLTHFVAGFLFDAAATAPFTVAVVTLSLLGVAFAACFFPARRATKVDPMIALRAE